MKKIVSVIAAAGIGLSALADAEEKFSERGYMPILDVLIFRDGITLEEAKEEAWISDDNIGKEMQIGQEGSYTYYCLTRNYATIENVIRESFTEEYYDEFAALVENGEQIASCITPAEPEPLKAEASEGVVISFETTDMDGNKVTSEDLFAGHKVTMINIWATWCGPCVEELAGLEALNSELVSKDCQIIGICDDTADDPQVIAEAKAILEEKGVTYTNLVQTDEMRDMLPTSAFPISYFVDSEGRILTTPEVGANLKSYGTRIEKALKDME